MPFADRIEAGRQLAQRLDPLRGEDVVVLGLPRGGVAVAYEVAVALDAPLDVIVVRKLGVPTQPELAMGAIGEDGVRVVNDDVVRLARVTDDQMAGVERHERAELERRAERFRAGLPRTPLMGRVALIVDDGIATGATARAACQVARAHGASRVVLAAPVAPAAFVASPAGDIDEVVTLEAPHSFGAIGQFYDDFSQTADDEVVSLLHRAAQRPGAGRAPDVAGDPVAGSAVTEGPVDDGPVDDGPVDDGPVDDGPVDDGPVDDGPVDDEVELAIDSVRLAGHLVVPVGARGVVAFAHGSGSGRHSPRNRAVAAALRRARLGTLLFDLLTVDEELDRANVFDIPLLGGRLVGATRWLHDQPAVRGRPIGYFGASTGAGAALWAAGERGADIAAVVSRGGRPDLAAERLADVRAPTLLVVGERDPQVEELNRAAQARMTCETRLDIVTGATHLFEEPGALEQVAGLAAHWFSTHMP